MRNALKDEKFRKLLAEYAEEISDPENKMVWCVWCGREANYESPANNMEILICSLLVAVRA